MVLNRRVLVATTLLSFTVSAPAQQVVFPTGARAGLVPPAGFAQATKFVGFENQEIGGAILVGDLPVGSVPGLLATYTPDGLAKGGIRAKEGAAAWPVAGGEGHIVRGQQDSGGVTYRRWLVLARTRDTGALVSAMVPEAAADKVASRIEAALRTIAFRPPPSLDEQIAALPFRVGDLAGFRPILATGGLSLLLTEGPSNDPPGATQPIVYLLANPSGAQGGRAENLAVARRLFETTPTLKQIETTKSEELEGGAVSRIEGKALTGRAGDEVEFVHLVRFANGGYMRSVGIWRRGEASRFRERFERLAASVAPR